MTPSVSVSDQSGTHMAERMWYMWMLSPRWNRGSWRASEGMTATRSRRTQLAIVWPIGTWSSPPLRGVLAGGAGRLGGRADEGDRGPLDRHDPEEQVQRRAADLPELAGAQQHLGQIVQHGEVPALLGEGDP